MNGTEQKEHRTALKELEAAFTLAIEAEEDARKRMALDLQQRMDKEVQQLYQSMDRTLTRAKAFTTEGDTLLAQLMARFMGHLTFRDRMRWIFKGTVKG